MLKVVVPFRTCDGKRVVVEAEGAMLVAVAKRRAVQLAGVDKAGEVRLVRGRELVDEGTTLEQLRLGPKEALVLVEIALPALVSDSARSEAATAEDIARATGGQAAAVAAPPVPAIPAPAAQEVQNRIRGFMESLFNNNEASSDEDEERRREGEGEGEEGEGEEGEEREGEGEAGAGQVEAGDEMAVEEASVELLTGMGFSANASRKALLHCGGVTERAMDWILEHAGDATLDEPVTPEQLAALRMPGPAAARRREQQRRPAFVPDADVAARLTDMGFAPDQVAEALRATRNNEEAAVSFLLGEGGAQNGGNDAADAPGMNMLDNPVLRALLMHPGIQEGLRNPRVLEAFRAIMMDPGAARDLLADPEVGPVLLQVNRVLREGGAADEEDEDEEGHHEE